MGMKLGNNDLAKWLLGAMLALIVVLIGMVWSSLNMRLDRIETEQTAVKAQIDAIRVQYSKIDVVLFRLDAIEKHLADR